MSLQELKLELEKRNIILTDKMLEQLDTYAKYLKEYNEKINLTAIVDYEEVIDKHFFDSLLLVNKQLEGTLVDVGSGAGFPGVVLKIVFPELNIILIEPIKKRCVFLESLIELLKLDKIKVINDRAEDYSLNHREEYDYVTARAVSNTNILIEVCGAMVKMDGYFINLKGSKGLEEISQAQKAIEKMGFIVESYKQEQLFNGDPRIIIYLKKVNKSPTTYPRKYNIIKKKPL